MFESLPSSINDSMELKLEAFVNELAIIVRKHNLTRLTQKENIK